MPRSKWSVAFEPALSLLVGSTAKAVVTDPETSPDGPLVEAREGILRLSQRDLAIDLRAGEIGALKWAKVELRVRP